MIKSSPEIELGWYRDHTMKPEQFLQIFNHAQFFYRGIFMTSQRLSHMLVL